MKEWRSFGKACVGVLILTIAAAVAEGENPRVTIPRQKTVLWVTAICGKGCESTNGNCDVYVLTEAAYASRKTNRDSEAKPNGQTPLLMETVTPGNYYVGIRCIVDTSIVKLKQSGFPPVSHPVYDEFFADDLPEEMESVVFTGEKPDPKEGGFRVYFALQKWYKVKVTDKAVTPVVGLFLEKQADPKEWMPYYPSESTFTVVLPPKNQEDVWNSLDLPGKSTPTVTADNRKVLSNLLTRGGRVCLPLPQKGVVWVTSEGLLNAVQRIPAEKIANRFATSMAVSTLARSEVNDSAGTSEVLPKFQNEIPKGTNEVRIRNPNEFAVTVGLRSAGKGRDFAVAEKTSASTLVPDGMYEIYFVYFTDPKALYRGDTFSLQGNGVEIQIVRVVNGNYAIRRVK